MPCLSIDHSNKGVQGTLHKVSGPLTPDVRTTKMKIARAIVWTPIILLLAMILTWLASEFRYAARICPTGKADTYHDYRQKMNAPRRGNLLEKDGQQYYALFGKVDAWFALPSGPPVYVFDTNGVMVDWTSDSGEDPEFTRTWTDRLVRQMAVEDIDAILLKTKDGANNRLEATGDPLRGSPAPQP